MKSRSFSVFPSFRLSVLPALALAVATAAPLVAQDVDLASHLPTDTSVTTGVFDNGLRYYIRANTRPEERAEMVVDGRILVTCEFCNSSYGFAPEDFAAPALP